MGIAAMVMYPVISVKPIANLPGREFLVNRKPCICPAVYAPVCVSNGITYNSKCHFHCAQLRQSDLIINYNGKCNEI